MFSVQDQMNNVAKFLEGRGLPELALEVATDPDYRFELAVQLGDLDIALSIAQTSESEAKWRQLGELAMSAGKLDVRPWVVYLVILLFYLNLFLTLFFGWLLGLAEGLNDRG
jgi:Coatomer WD associated region